MWFLFQFTANMQYKSNDHQLCSTNTLYNMHTYNHNNGYLQSGFHVLWDDKTPPGTQKKVPLLKVLYQINIHTKEFKNEELIPNQNP